MNSSRAKILHKLKATLKIIDFHLQIGRWRRYDPLKRRLTLNGLHCVISPNMKLSITTATVDIAGHISLVARTMYSENLISWRKWICPKSMNMIMETFCPSYCKQLTGGGKRRVNNGLPASRCTLSCGKFTIPSRTHRQTKTVLLLRTWLQWNWNLLFCSSQCYAVQTAEICSPDLEMQDDHEWRIWWHAEENDRGLF
jgi:hypothetical protein